MRICGSALHAVLRSDVAAVGAGVAFFVASVVGVGAGAVTGPNRSMGYVMYRDFVVMGTVGLLIVIVMDFAGVVEVRKVPVYFCRMDCGVGLGTWIGRGSGSKG